MKLPANSTRRLRIAIASVDIAGPYQCGGVGAAYHGLALALAEEGHDVTILYLHHKFHQGGEQEWTDYFNRRGIRFVHLPQRPESPIWYANRKEASLRCHQWLSRQPAFDVIHFHEWLGIAYYSLLAKWQELAYQKTILCVGAHGSMRWNRMGDETLATRTEDLVVDFLERKSVELADAVVSPSGYLLQWMEEDGWKLPRNCFVVHNVLERRKVDPQALAIEAAPIREVVFFGRLDRRKGLPFFCDVIDQLEKQHDFTVTFLGSNVAIDGKTSEDYVRARSASWQREPAILTSLGRTEALEYLSGQGRLAVMPSQVDNSPCTVQECIAEGIPFLASDRGGIPELVHPEDHGRVNLPLTQNAFSAALERALTYGHAPAKQSESLLRGREAWVQWHAVVSEMIENFRAPAPKKSGVQPVVTVCIGHRDSPSQLEQLLQCLRKQTWPRLEVIVVDDGSSSSEANTYLRGLEEEFAQTDWRLLRQEHSGTGVAKDRAARAATGSLLLFAEAGAILLPHAIERFVQVAEHTTADAVSCVLLESEANAVLTTPEGGRLRVPLGPALAAGLISPEFGEAVYMLRRDCYEAIGGYPTQSNVDEDWELLLAVVSGGYQLQVIPEPLAKLHGTPEIQAGAERRFAQNQSRVRRYEKLLPFELRDLAGLALSKLSGAPDAGTQRRLERVIESLQKARRERAVNPS